MYASTTGSMERQVEFSAPRMVSTIDYPAAPEKLSRSWAKYKRNTKHFRSEEDYRVCMGKACFLSGKLLLQMVRTLVQ